MIIRRINTLHPELQGITQALEQYLAHAYETRLTKTNFKLFETFRTPDRQASLFAQKTSKALPWQSAHQYGLAVDFVPYLSVQDIERLEIGNKRMIRVGWNWDSWNDYQFLKVSGEKFGLSSTVFSWDKCHLEHPKFSLARRRMMETLKD